MATEATTQNTSGEIRRVRRAHHYGLTGPLLLIALGVMFLVGQFDPAWGISRTWPVLLIVLGLAKLLEAAWPGRPSPSN
ncbi:MAG TPA: DUF5668 domain-containing protein [Terriglobia bacterium]|jgi:hypothetical protein|nr:DUF5668 domain-containing protein [Terriglobia bacterium]